MKIAILDGFLPNPGDLSWEPITKHGEAKIFDNTSPEEMIEHIGDAEGVFINRCSITKEVMEACPSIRFINPFGTGVNMIDLQEAKRRGITVCNVPAYGGPPVAQMTIALLLGVACKTGVFDNYLKTNGWEDPADPYIAHTIQSNLNGKTIGLIGFGSIAKRVAEIAQALGMKVLAYCRRPDLSFESGTLRFCSFDELLKNSDVVSIHCPLTDETRGMVNGAAIAKMKDGAILINTARGAVTDEDAVLRALESGKLFGAGIDVWSHEPFGKNFPLANHPRCLATPHVAWAPQEIRAGIIKVIGENIEAYLKGQPQNVIV